MKKLAPQTKSFIILFCIALIGTYVCLIVASRIIIKVPRNSNLFSAGSDITTTSYSNQIQSASAADITPAVDTSDWMTYANQEFGFSMKYKPDWKIKAPVTKDGYTMIAVDPGAKYYNIKIYISKKGYLGIDSMPTTQEDLNGRTLLSSSNNMMYGIQNNGNYYTFYVGLSTSLRPNFSAMVHSITFQ